LRRARQTRRRKAGGGRNPGIEHGSCADLLLSAILTRKLAEELGKSEHRTRSISNSEYQPGNAQEYQVSNQSLTRYSKSSTRGSANDDRCRHDELLLKTQPIVHQQAVAAWLYFDLTRGNKREWMRPDPSLERKNASGEADPIANPLNVVGMQLDQGRVNLIEYPSRIFGGVSFNREIHEAHVSH
jgi:hypothetical protein